MISFKHQKIQVEYLDNVREISPFILLVSNANQQGYDFSLTPQAESDDGLLHLFWMEKSNVFNKIKFFLYGLLKKKLMGKRFDFISLSTLKIRLLDQDDFCVQIDGENLPIFSFSRLVFMGGLKAYRLLVLPMRRLLSIIVLSLMVMSSVPQETHLEDDKSVYFVDSPLSFSFTNGPAAAEEIKGVKTLTFNVNGGNDENISSMVLEIQLSDGSWSEVRNLTESPWLVYFDSTQYANGSYQLRVRGWDHNVSNHTDWTISNQFSIVNQEPVITQFTLEGIAYGDGSTSSNRAWLSTPLEGNLNFSWSVLDDDLSHASLGNTPGLITFIFSSLTPISIPRFLVKFEFAMT